jgi:hypothetical protein
LLHASGVDVWETSGHAPQRSWLVNVDGSGNRPFYVRTDPETWFTPLKEWVTHEAWVKETGGMALQTRPPAFR